jgi:hypothetical protein
VIAVNSIGFPDPEDRLPSEYFIVTVEPERSVVGSKPSAITILWEGFLTDGAGNRTMRFEQNGVAMPDEGERLLLFLIDESPERKNLVGGGITHQLNTLDGILYIDGEDRLITTLYGTDRPAHQLAGQELGAVETLLTSP